VIICSSSKPYPSGNVISCFGLHPKDCSALYPYILNKHPNQQPGANLSFQDLFDLVYPFLTHMRLAAEAEAKAKAEAKAETVQ
jgi:hypothetical protein